MAPSLKLNLKPKGSQVTKSRPSKPEHRPGFRASPAKKTKGLPPSQRNNKQPDAKQGVGRDTSPKKGASSPPRLSGSPKKKVETFGRKKRRDSTPPKSTKDTGDSRSPKKESKAVEGKDPIRRSPRGHDASKEDKEEDKSPTSPRGSKSKTPPASNKPNPKLVKQNGKLLKTGKQVIPDHVLDGRVRKRFPQTANTHSRGLWNKANFCYRNAMIQAILHTPPFYRYLGRMHRDCESTAKQCVTCALQALAQTYWNDTSVPRAPKGPLAAVKTFNEACANNIPTVELLPGAYFEGLDEDFVEENQADTMEFLQYLLTLIEDKALPTDDTPFNSVFRIPHDRFWHCDDCGQDEIKPLEPDEIGSKYSIDIHIENPSGLTLVEYMRMHMAETRSHHCDKPGPCGDRYNKAKLTGEDGPERKFKFFITSAPEVLIIRLKRFNWYYGMTKVPKKIKTPVPFDEYLNMGEFTQSGDDLMYRLDAVIAHSGNTIEHGHNIAVCREVSGRTFISLNDDSLVGPTEKGRGSFQEMTTPRSGGKATFEPYVLMYTKM